MNKKQKSLFFLKKRESMVAEMGTKLTQFTTQVEHSYIINTRT